MQCRAQRVGRLDVFHALDGEGVEAKHRDLAAHGGEVCRHVPLAVEQDAVGALAQPRQREQLGDEARHAGDVGHDDGTAVSISAAELLASASSTIFAALMSRLKTTQRVSGRTAPATSCWSANVMAGMRMPVPSGGLGGEAALSAAVQRSAKTTMTGALRMAAIVPSATDTASPALP